MMSAFYTGNIAHKRSIPVTHQFSYPFFMWFLNLDKMEEIPYLGKWFSTKGWAMSRFRRSDYYGDPDIPLADAIRQRMEELTNHPVTGHVCGLLNLRTLGLYFSPVNFYYGYDSSGHLSHFLAEVSNIPWNQRHQYAHYIGDNNLQPAHIKEFHVSPFNSVNQHYKWTLQMPGENLGVQLEVLDERGRIFQAHLNLQRHPLNLQSITKTLIKKPAMTIFIVAGIYWQAAKLFLKGVPYVPYQKEIS